MSVFKDHFSSLSAGYASYRPIYPQALADLIGANCTGHQLALDCGCGNGQLSQLLAENFDKVVACDASASQIAQAVAHSKISYQVAPAHQIPLPDSSVDLVTVAQAVHWFDLPSFYAEVCRLGRPGALIALISYATICLEGEAQQILEHFYNRVVGPYWPEERRLVENGYQDLDFPFEPVAIPDLEMSENWTLDQLIGYVSTWSATRIAREQLDFDPVPAFAEQLAPLWGGRSHKVYWPLHCRAGRINPTPAAG